MNLDDNDHSAPILFGLIDLRNKTIHFSTKSKSSVRESLHAYLTEMISTNLPLQQTFNHLGHHINLISIYSVDGEKTHSLIHIRPPSLHNPILEKLLTPRQLAIAQQAALGKTSNEIADSLHISPETVRTHIKSIYRRLGVHNRIELARLVLQDE